MGQYLTIPLNKKIGYVGMTQSEAMDKGYEIYVAIKNYSTIAKGFALGFEKGQDDDGFVKLIVDKSYKILGAHVIGPNAALLVQPFVYLMNHLLMHEPQVAVRILKKMTNGFLSLKPSKASSVNIKTQGNAGRSCINTLSFEQHY